MKYFTLHLLAFISIFQICTASIDEKGCCETNIEFSYSMGRYISINNDYFDIGLFTPLVSSIGQSLFLDIHGYRFNDSKWATSIGLAERYQLSELNIVGFNLYYDYRRGKSKNNFHQMGLGFEWLNDCWDIRINGYLPVSKKTQTASFCLFDQLGDGFFATRRNIEFAYSGFDTEIGHAFENYCDINLYAAVGPYYYQRADQRHFWGAHCRLELNWKSIFSLSIRLSNDNIYSTNVQGIFQVSFPIDFFNLNSCFWQSENNCPFSQSVWRNGIILTDHCCDWTWNWADKN